MYDALNLMEKKMRSKCRPMLRVVDDDVESRYKIDPDVFDLFYKVMSLSVSHF